MGARCIAYIELYSGEFMETKFSSNILDGYTGHQNAKVVKCQVMPTGVVVQGLRKASVCKTVHVKTVHNGVLYLKIC